MALALIPAIVQIGVGAYFIDACPLEKMIPMYLIVSGAAFVLIILMRCCIKKMDDAPQCLQIFSCILILFCVAWFIAGNVWVFKNWDAAEDEDECNSIVYGTALWFIIFKYISIGISLLAVCCGCTKATEENPA